MSIMNRIIANIPQRLLLKSGRGATGEGAAGFFSALEIRASLYTLEGALVRTVAVVRSNAG